MWDILKNIMLTAINLDGIDFKVTVQYKNNKRTYCHLQGNKQILITCNSSVSDATIASFLHSRSQWVIDHDKQLTKHHQRLDVTNTSTINLFGKQIKIAVLLGKQKAHMDKECLIIYVEKLSSANIESAIYAYASKQMEQLIAQMRIKWDNVLVNDYHLSLPQITLKRLRGKWGVCTPKLNKISLSIYLCHYEPKVIEAVLWHEYVHLIVPNHSKRFYDVLLFHMSDYKQRHQQLKN